MSGPAGEKGHDVVTRQWVPYQFAVLRYCHNAAVGEFANVGVVLWMPTVGRLLTRIDTRSRRLSCFFQNFDGSSYRSMVRRLRARWEMLRGRLDIAPGEVASIDALLPRLLHPDAGCFQWSAPMGGALPDPALRFERLYAEWVCPDSRRTAEAPLRGGKR